MKGAISFGSEDFPDGNSGEVDTKGFEGSNDLKEHLYVTFWRDYLMDEGKADNDEAARKIFDEDIFEGAAFDFVSSNLFSKHVKREIAYLLSGLGILEVEDAAFFSVSDRKNLNFVELNTLVERSGRVELKEILESVKANVLKVLTIVEISRMCKSFSEFNELFVNYFSSKQVSQQFFHPDFFVLWLDKASCNEEIAEVLKKLGSADFIGYYDFVVPAVFAKLDRGRLALIFDGFFAKEEYKSLFLTLDACNVFFERCDDIKTCSVFVGKILENYRSLYPDVLDFVVKTFVEKSLRSVEDFLFAIGILDKYKVEVSEDFVEKIPLSPEFCAGLYERIVANYKDPRAGVAYNKSPITRYVDYRDKKLGTMREFNARDLIIFRRIYDGYLYHTKDPSYICECAHSDDFMTMVRKALDEGVEPDDSMIGDLKLRRKTYSSEVCKRLEAYFADDEVMEEPIDLRKESNLYVLGEDFDSGIGWLKLYDNLRNSERDIVNRCMDLVMTMWEKQELLLSPGDFFEKFDMGKKVEGFYENLVEFYSSRDKEGVSAEFLRYFEVFVSFFEAKADESSKRRKDRKKKKRKGRGKR